MLVMSPELRGVIVGCPEAQTLVHQMAAQLVSGEPREIRPSDDSCRRE